VILVKWILAIALSLQLGCGLSPISMDFGGYDSPDGVDYGYLPVMNNNLQKTVNIWVYMLADTPEGQPSSDTLIGKYSGFAGWLIMAGSGSGHPVIGYTVRYLSGLYTWYSSDRLSLNTWHMVTVSSDYSSDIYSLPKFYIDSVETTANIQYSASGTLLDETGTHIIIGNRKTSIYDWNSGLNGKLFDPRIYNRVLTQAEITEIYNAGVPSEQAGTKDGLVFQPFAVHTENLSNYIDQSLTSNLTIRDNIFGAVGIPHGAPIAREAP
jgi:hypothetical protein